MKARYKTKAEYHRTVHLPRMSDVERVTETLTVEAGDALEAAEVVIDLLRGSKDRITNLQLFVSLDL